MSLELRELIESLPGLRVVVIGEAILDSYLRGAARRISREAPVPIVAVGEQDEAPGGAANAAVNVAALGGSVRFVSVVGDDREARALRDALAARGVDTEGLVVEPSRLTLCKTRVLADGQAIVRFDTGTTRPAGRDAERTLIERLETALADADALVVSDYGYGVLTPQVVETIARAQRRSPRVVVLDAKEPERYRNVGVTAVKPNWDEAVRLLGLPPSLDGEARIDALAAAGDRLLDVTGARLAAVTIDSAGALVFERGHPPYRTYSRPVHNSRATGAGDTFVGALAVALAAGAHTAAAAELASAASAVVLGKDGTAVCSASELLERIAGPGKILDEDERLERRIEYYRSQGRRVVFTNGCFDILHRGHITYLNQAKGLGDVLVVGLNSDDSVRRLKGSGRPINSLDDRAQVLSALSSVDHIVPFAEETPIELVRRVRPDVYVKGGDYTREMLPESAVVEALGGAVHILPYVEDRSTTGIIEHIRGEPEPAVRPVAADESHRAS